MDCRKFYFIYVHLQLLSNCNLLNEYNSCTMIITPVSVGCYYNGQIFKTIISKLPFKEAVAENYIINGLFQFLIVIYRRIKGIGNPVYTLCQFIKISAHQGKTCAR